MRTYSVRVGSLEGQAVAARSAGQVRIVVSQRPGYRQRRKTGV